MTPFYFGHSTQPLFGAYHAPTGLSDLNAGIVMCYPIGHEYNRVHRLYGQTAIQLSRMGLHVFRFDYFGTGDSSGSFVDATYNRWCEDVQAAIVELQAISGVSNITLVGSRLGANIAVESSNTTSLKTKIKQVVCWDPIMDSKIYLEELTALDNQMLADPLRFLKPRVKKVANELIGFEYSPELRCDLVRGDLQTKHFAPKKLLILASQDTAESTGSFQQKPLFQNVACATEIMPIDSGWQNVELIEMAIKIPEFADIILKASSDV